MRDLQAKLSLDGATIHGSAINFGEWDIEAGMLKTIYLYNPNDYAKADLTGIKNADSRVQIELPDEVLPLKSGKVSIRIPPMKFESEADEKAFFTDVIDSLEGKIVWRKP